MNFDPTCIIAHNDQRQPLISRKSFLTDCYCIAVDGKIQEPPSPQKTWKGQPIISYNTTQLDPNSKLLPLLVALKSIPVNGDTDS